MKFKIMHSTQYQYSQPVGFCHSEARLLPRECPEQNCFLSRLEIIPEPSDYEERIDFFGNRVSYFTLQEQHTSLRVSALSEIEKKDIELSQNSEPVQSWEKLQTALVKKVRKYDFSVLMYTVDSEQVITDPVLRDYAMESFKPGISVTDVALDVTHRIFQDFTYDPTFSTIDTPLSTILEHKRGVCQDFAHIAIACFRSFGLPARYVSGYIETYPRAGEEKLQGSDASHAWFSVYTPENGWLDFDPTNNCRVSSQHVTLAWGRDFNDVTPLKGHAVGGDQHAVSVSVDMERIE